MFCKIFKKYTQNALWIRLVIVLVGFLFDMHISLILKIQSLSVWKLSCENFSLLAEAKCHAVWKMIVGSKLVLHQHVLYKSWKAIPFILLPLSLGRQMNCTKKCFLFRWLNNSKKKVNTSLGEQHRANVGPTSKFANLKVLNSLVYQQLINIGPTLTLIVYDNVLKVYIPDSMTILDKQLLIVEPHVG